ncbi:hypothetical protein EB118_11860 [bacterium]|nr:hypothetical protein [bacterium]NDD83660.1 hypothetical protein [bacterium]NDG30755.1 hypothetical protein [bacterium]
MRNNYTDINYDGKEYIVGITNKNDPFLIDKHVLEKLSNAQPVKRGEYISVGGVYLHNLVRPGKPKGMTIDHINQIKTDNRESNLRFATQSEQNRNQSKKKRNIELPEGCGIDPQKIPTFIWYVQPCGKHGDRWAVEVKGKYEWKTTSSKTISTKCKFELAKKHLRELMNNSPSLFEGHVSNGELSDQGKRLEKEYHEIMKLAKHKLGERLGALIVHQEPLESTYNYLEEDTSGLSESEKALLQNDTSKEKQQPQGARFDLPPYCCYIKENNVKGDGFYVARNHPKQNGKDWYTSRSKKINLDDKYTQLMEYVQKLNNSHSA